MKIMTQEEMAEIYRQSGIPAASTMASLSQQEPTYEDRLREELDQLRQDAARYRWLRKGASDEVAVVRGLGAMDYGMSAVVSTYSEEIDGDDLDAAIDAAMQARKQGGE